MSEECPSYLGQLRVVHPDGERCPRAVRDAASTLPDLEAKVRPKRGDGHCLYRPRKNLPSNEKWKTQALELRRQLADFQRMSPDVVSFGGANETYSSRATAVFGVSLIAYTGSTKASNADPMFGGLFEIDAFAKITSRKVIIYEATDVSDRFKAWASISPKSPKNKTVHVAFKAKGLFSHYDYLEPVVTPW